MEDDRSDKLELGDHVPRPLTRDFVLDAVTDLGKMMTALYNSAPEALRPTVVTGLTVVVGHLKEQHEQRLEHVASDGCGHA